MIGLFGFGILAILVAIFALVVIWIIVSIPVYLAAKTLTDGRATLGQAMGTTLLGPIVYGIVSYLATFFLGSLGITQASLISLILAFLAWLAVYKSSFKTGWLQALGIAILATVILAIAGTIAVAVVPLALNLF